MMKKLLIAAITAIMCFCFVGCGNDSAADPAAEGQAPTDTAWAEGYDKILSDPYGFDEFENEAAAPLSYVMGWYGIEFMFDKYFLYDLDQNGTPELYLWSDKNHMALVANYDGNDTVISGMFSFDRINAKAGELLEQSTWQGDTRSEENEWYVFKYDDKGILTETSFFDYGFPEEESVCVMDPETGEIRENASMDEYNQLYDEHVKPSTDIEELPMYDLNDRTAFAEFGVSMENANEVNELEVYHEALQNICDGKDAGSFKEKVPVDVDEHLWQTFEAGGTPSFYYDLKDLDNNGVRELVIGVDQGDGTRPAGVYVVEDGKAVPLMDLYYYETILSDGTINTLQGGEGFEEHPDGYFYRLDGSKVTEVSNPDLEPMEFNWKELHQNAEY